MNIDKAMPDTNTVIEAHGLSKSYGKKVALDGAEFKVGRGRIVGLIGPNGAGKTTAIKAILGLTAFTGTLKVLGLDPFKQREALMQQACFIADVAILPRWARVQDLVGYVEGVHPRFNRSRCEALLAATKEGKLKR